MGTKKKPLTRIPARNKTANSRNKMDTEPAAEPQPDLSHILEDLRHLAVRCDSVQFDPQNPKDHPDENVESLRASLRQFGQRRPIVVNGRTRIVEAGNCFLQAVLAEGHEYIAAVFPDDDPGTARAYSVIDNRSSELGSWSGPNLALGMAEMTTGRDPVLDAMMAKLAEEQGLFATAAPTPGAGGDDFDPEPALAGECRVKPGELWLIDGGKHRLLCGDSTKTEDVARVMGGEKAGLMNTDPPYGVAYANDDRPNPGVAKPRVANDKLADEALQTFLESVFTAAVDYALTANAAWYLWHAHLTQGYFAAAAAAANVVLHRQIIWVKPVLLLGRGHYHWKHEPCFMGWVDGHQPPDYGLGNGERTQTTVWEINGVSQAERKEFNHSTPKPVELFTVPMVKHLKAGEIAFEPFAGSGPQFIAAHRTGRRCFGLELEPRHCSVILARCETEGLSVEQAP